MPDSANRLTQCIYNNQTNTYVYGSDGLRHRSTTNAITTDFALDGDSVVREIRGGVNYATYLSGPTGPMYRRSDGDGTIRWYVYDGLGSVVGEVDPNGVMTARRGFDVYGATRSSSGTPTTKHGFVGALGHTTEGETGGLIYMRARYYDPQVGRFTSEDSYKTLNRFTYCANNPVNDFDGDGHISLGDTAAALTANDNLSASEDAGLQGFCEWYEGQLAQALEKESVDIIVEMVDEGDIVTDFGAVTDGGFEYIKETEQMIIRLDPNADMGTFAHELGEALAKAENPGVQVLHTETEMYMRYIIRIFMETRGGPIIGG